MLRRSFLKTGLSAGAALSFVPGAASASAAALTPRRTRVFEVTTAVDLSAVSDPVQLWLPVFRSGPGQKRLAVKWEARAELVHDRHSGAEILKAQWTGSAPRKLTLTQRVATWERAPGSDGAASLTHAERALWLEPTSTAEDRLLVSETVRGIVGDLRDPKAKARAIYDWIVANTYRDAKVPGCGTGDVPAMLRGASMGGKCADLNGMMVCMCRAAGIPAREIYGIRLAKSERFNSLGRAGDVTGAQHCRAEIWLEGAGWFAVDPADVRKAVLEEKLPVTEPRIVALANDLFGTAEANWAGYNSAYPIALAGAPLAPRFRFLMYPTAMTAHQVVDSLDAAHFAYRITSSEVTA